MPRRTKDSTPASGHATPPAAPPERAHSDDGTTGAPAGDGAKPAAPAPPQPARSTGAAAGDGTRAATPATTEPDHSNHSTGTPTETGTTGRPTAPAEDACGTGAAAGGGTRPAREVTRAEVAAGPRTVGAGSADAPQAGRPDAADTADTADTADAVVGSGDGSVAGADGSGQAAEAAGTSAVASIDPLPDDTRSPGEEAPGGEEASDGIRAGSETGASGHSRSGSGSGSRSRSREAVPVDPRVVAVRRLSAAGRRWRGVQLAGCAALLAVALTAGAVAVGAARDGGGTAVASASGGLAPGLLGSGDLDTGITALQAHLRVQPRDFGGWATLGLAYVEQARTTGDPSRYPQADRALKRSLELEPDNDQALSGRAALAAARHDFEDALAYADRALEQNPYSERALSSRIDALVELGRYDEAAEAAGTADARRPGVPVFTRYAYVRELRGDVPAARRVLEQALATATAPGDVAYVSTALGRLAWNQGDHEAALHHYARALAADEDCLPALEGRARAQAASGDRAAAITGMEAVVARHPLPGPLVVLGELYEVRGAEGDAAKAHDQYALVDAWTALARTNKVNADLDTALAAADHGDRAEALRAARAEWDRRRTVHTADALAWALHVNGRDEEALPYARRATATGYRDAAFLYHRGMIERALGQEEAARTHLTAALKLNPGFSPLGAQEARTALEAAR